MCIQVVEMNITVNAQYFLLFKSNVSCPLVNRHIYSKHPSESSAVFQYDLISLTSTINIVYININNYTRSVVEY